jgi:hypothetical protein
MVGSKYYYGGQIKKRLAGYVAHLGKTDSYKILVGKSERKRPLGHLGIRGPNNIKNDSREERCGLD